MLEDLRGCLFLRYRIFKKEKRIDYQNNLNPCYVYATLLHEVAGKPDRAAVKSRYARMNRWISIEYFPITPEGHSHRGTPWKEATTAFC